MANIINITGIVLREVSYKESDKILSILTKEKGNISVYAHSVKKLDSQLFSTCQLYAYASFSIYENRGKYHIKEATLIESFYDICKTLEGSALASYISEVALDVTQEELEEENILRLVLNSLYCIANNVKPLWQIKSTFEIKCCSELGYMPETSTCNKCGKIDMKDSFLNVTQGYVVCPECYHKSDVMSLDKSVINELEGIYLHPNVIIEITYSVGKAIDYIIKSKIEKAFSFKISEQDIPLFIQVCEKFFKAHIDKEFSSLAFYNSISQI